MRFKRARAGAELAAEVRSCLSEASDERCQAEVQARTEALKQNSLLIEQWDLEDCNADLSRCGVAGSPTKVHRVQSIVLTKEGFTDIPPTEDGVRGMIHELVEDRTLG